jgi:uncharacterized repeat protein (TIGR01451 family)
MRIDAKRAGRSGRSNRAVLAAASAASAALLAPSAHAAGTPAGTNIQNVATATYEESGGAQTTVESNVVSMKVDELLDVTVSSAEPSDVGVSPGTTGQALRFTITNGGNGPESFGLATVANGGGDDFDPAVTSIVLDANGNNAYDAGVDTAYVAGSNDPLLQPDASLSVFVLASIPAAASDGQRGRVDLTAVSRTGAGSAGTSFAGKGEGGGNAVAGATGADAEASAWFRIARTAMSFAKTFSVADPFGGTAPVPGATITFTLTATVVPNRTLANVRIADSIPAGTTYAPGTITLDGAALSDAEDGDVGRFAGSGIAVTLGSLSGGATRTVTFKVKID